MTRPLYSALAGSLGLALLLGACDTSAPSASASFDPFPPVAVSLHQTTIVPLDKNGSDLTYAFADADSTWDGTFSVTTYDKEGTPIVTFEQEAWQGTSGATRYGIDFSWNLAIAENADIYYLDILGNNVQVRSIMTNAEGDDDDGDGGAPGHSFHTDPEGETRVDYPREGDPNGPSGGIRNGLGEPLVGITDVAVRFKEGTVVPIATEAHFHYPHGVTFTYQVED